MRKPKTKMPETNQDPKMQGASRATGESIGISHPVVSEHAFHITLLLICSLAGVYIWFAVRMYHARRLSASHNQLSLQRAIQLQPQDANNHDLLGQYFMWDAQDAHAAASQFQQAVRLDPYASAYWLHLAQAESSLGDDGEQAIAIENALAVDPTTPEIAWAAANFFLVQGKTDEALDQFAVVVRNDPFMAETALEVSWRAVREVDPIQRRMPPDPEIYLKFIKLLVARQQWAAADQVWSSMLHLNRGFEASSALFYVDALLAKRDVAAAQIIWRQIADRSSRMQPYITPGNLVVNARFDQEFLNAAFDWHYSTQPGVDLVLDPTQSYQGSEALLIKYSGGSNEDAGLSQYIPVNPGTSYIASAWVKSEELQSANGPQLVVYDGYRNQEYARSDETLGTSSWHLVRASFTTGKDTDLVVIRFSRLPGSTLIQGRFWITDLHMSQAAPEDTRSPH